jgi:hypothetical protein
MPIKSRKLFESRMTNVQRVLHQWESQGLPLIPPADRETVIRYLEATGKRFARDVVDLYCTTGGLDDWMDDLMFTLWPLRRIRSTNAVMSGDDLYFADMLISSFEYFLRAEDGERSAVYGGYETRKLADSIEEFFGLYLNDPAQIDLF